MAFKINQNAMSKGTSIQITRLTFRCTLKTSCLMFKSLNGASWGTKLGLLWLTIFFI